MALILLFLLLALIVIGLKGWGTDSRDPRYSLWPPEGRPDPEYDP